MSAGAVYLVWEEIVKIVCPLCKKMFDGKSLGDVCQECKYKEGDVMKMFNDIFNKKV